MGNIELLDAKQFKYARINADGRSLNRRGSWQHRLTKHSRLLSRCVRYNIKRNELPSTQTVLYLYFGIMFGFPWSFSVLYYEIHKRICAQFYYVLNRDHNLAV